jgi:hypothetical protein
MNFRVKSCSSSRHTQTRIVRLGQALLKSLKTPRTRESEVLKTGKLINVAFDFEAIPAVCTKRRAYSERDYGDIRNILDSFERWVARGTIAWSLAVMILDNIAPDIDEAIKDGTIKLPPGRRGVRVNTPGIGDDFFLSAGKFNPAEHPRRDFHTWEIIPGGTGRITPEAPGEITPPNSLVNSPGNSYDTLLTESVRSRGRPKKKTSTSTVTIDLVSIAGSKADPAPSFANTYPDWYPIRTLRSFSWVFTDGKERSFAEGRVTYLTREDAREVITRGLASLG